MTIAFKPFALSAALLCVALALVWSVLPAVLLSLWSVPSSDAAGFLGRRMAALFLGIGVLLFRVRHAPPSPARAAVSTGLTAGCAALALLGAFELALGHAGPGILMAVAVEALLALGFFLAR